MMKISEAIKKYEKYVTVTKSKGTLDYLRGKTGIINQYLGDKEDCEIDNDVLLEFIIEQQKRNPYISNRTLNKYIQTLKQVLKYSSNIEIEFEKMPVRHKMIQTIPDHIQDRIFTYYEHNQTNVILLRNYVLFRLLNETGLRISELLSLKVRDFDFKTFTIHVKITKTNNERYVFYSKKTNLLINKYLVASRVTNHLFIDFITGDVLSVVSVESLCQRLAKKLSLNQSISPHKWRHTFASRFIKRNGNLEVLRQIMGHTSLTTTQKYLHLNKDHLHEEYFRVSNE